MFGAAQQVNRGLLGRASCGLGDLHADARAHAQLCPLCAEGLLHRATQAGSQGGGFALVASWELGELVAAQARHGVPGAHHGGQAAADGHEQVVADLIAERVVDLLEAVEIDEEHGQGRVGFAPARARRGRAPPPSPTHTRPLPRQAEAPVP